MDSGSRNARMATSGQLPSSAPAVSSKQHGLALSETEVELGEAQSREDQEATPGMALGVGVWVRATGGNSSPGSARVPKRLQGKKAPDR